MSWTRDLANQLRIAILATCLISTAACGESADSADSETTAPTTTVAGTMDGVSDDELSQQAATWVNMTGLAESDPTVWRERLERACTEGVWDNQVATQLAEQFIEDDLPASVRAPDLGRPQVQDGAQALWLMAANVCRDAFPEGAIDSG